MKQNKNATLPDMPDHFLKIYVGGTKHGDKREANVRALALKHFPKSSGKEGNISALFNHALNILYNLDPETGEQRPDNIAMVSEPPKPRYRTKK